MGSNGPDDVQGVGLLADPLRRRLYGVVAEAREPLSREQVAAAAEVAVHTAKFHLDKLVDEGLLEVEFRRLTGRTGPGSGRPAKLYRRSAREIAVSLPARQYDLLSRILANAVAQSVTEQGSVVEIAGRIARSEGEAVGRAHPGSAAGLDAVASALSATGYEPQVTDAAVLELRNCPFHRAAEEQRDLVCGLNLEFVGGVCDGMVAEGLRPELAPGEGRCCVTVSAI